MIVGFGYLILVMIIDFNTFFQLYYVGIEDIVVVVWIVVRTFISI